MSSKICEFFKNNSKTLNSYITSCIQFFQEKQDYESQLLAIQAFRAMVVIDERIFKELNDYLLNIQNPFENALRLTVITTIVTLCSDIKPFINGLLVAIMNQGYGQEDSLDSGWRHEMAIQIISSNQHQVIHCYLNNLLKDETATTLLKATVIFLFAKAGGFSEIIFLNAYKLLQQQKLAINGKFKSNAIEDVLYALTKISLTYKQKELLALEIERHLLQFSLYGKWGLMYILEAVNKLYQDTPYLIDRKKIISALKEEFGSNEGCNLDYLQLVSNMPFLKDLIWHEVTFYLTHQNLWNRFGALEVMIQWKISEENKIQILEYLIQKDPSKLIREKSLEALAVITSKHNEIIEKAILFLQTLEEEKLQIALTILKNSWRNKHFIEPQLDRVVHVLIVTIKFIDYKVPFLNFLLEILLIEPKYLQISISLILGIADQSRELKNFSIRNENIDYAWYLLSHFDLTNWLSQLPICMLEKPTYSPILAKTPLTALIKNALNNPDGVYFIFCKVYNESLPLVIGKNSIVIFEQNKSHSFKASKATLEKMESVFRHFCHVDTEQKLKNHI